MRSEGVHRVRDEVAIAQLARRHRLLEALAVPGSQRLASAAEVRLGDAVGALAVEVELVAERVVVREDVDGDLVAPLLGRSEHDRDRNEVLSDRREPHAATTDTRVGARRNCSPRHATQPRAPPRWPSAGGSLCCDQSQ